MRVFVSGLSLGLANLDKQVFLLARNIEEREIQESGRIVGNAEVNHSPVRKPLA